MKTQKVLVPIPVEERLPEVRRYVLWSYKMANGILFMGVLKEDGRILIDTDCWDTQNSIQSKQHNFTHWYEEQERIVLTEDEYKKLVNGTK